VKEEIKCGDVVFFKKEKTPKKTGYIVKSVLELKSGRFLKIELSQNTTVIKKVSEVLPWRKF